MPNGYNGKILRVNLSKRTIIVEEPTVKFYRRYMGGRGFISYFLLKEVPQNADPLGPENKLIFAASVVTGAPVPGFGRQSVGAKSPLTGFYGESESGGFWGPELKFAGFDAIIVEGESSKPVYLWIHDGEVEIRDASHIWGQETGISYDRIIDELKDPKVKTLIIGPAGENKVKMAGIAHDLSHYHGRTGMGAVMGSKKLKAIIVRGTQKLTFADPAKLQEIAKFFADNFKQNADNNGQRKHGTTDYYFGAQHAGSLPTRNFTTGVFEELTYNADDLHEKLKLKAEGCYACPVRCKQVFTLDAPYKIDPKFGGPEFETLAGFGSLCGVSDMFAAPKAHEICNRLGLDTVSASVTIAWAMECFERGLLTTEDTGGLELKFGNQEVMLQLLEMMAYRKGFGAVICDGSLAASKIIGRGTDKYAMQVKGQEFAMAEPRAKYGVGLAYAVSPTGADHLQHEHDGAFDSALTGYSHTADDPNTFLKTLYPMGLLEPVPSLSLNGEKVQLFTYLQHYWSMFNCLDICIFTVEPVRTMKVNQIVEVLQAVTGWESSLFEIMKVGERATTMARCFNLKQGLTRADDTLPDRLFEELQGGPLKGSKLNREDFEKSVGLYYEMMGWSREDGVPTEGKLFELGIGWAIDEIKKN